ncbi:MAG TPA: sigma-w pathway protein ysdB [Bacillus bacterium]|nr:sigma-w pathway protein ysdB [Bacillus sp. (in: firmicutes)]
MFTVILFRFLILALIIFLIVKTVKYILNPKRKLELAHEQKQFYFWDDRDNVRKNFLITYKGVLFEGEKYLGTTENAFDVVSIFIWAKDTNKLQGLERKDFLKIEEAVKKNYPNARIDWKNPIRNFLNHEE